MHLFEKPLLELRVVFDRVFNVVLLCHVGKHFVELAPVRALLHLSLGACDGMLLQKVFLVPIFQPQLVPRVHPHPAQLLQLFLADLGECFLSLIVLHSARQLFHRGGMSRFFSILMYALTKWASRSVRPDQ